MTFQELKTEVSAYAEDRPDIAARAGSLINRAKLRIQRKANFFFMLKTSPPLTYSATDNGMELPSDFKQLRSVYVNGHPRRIISRQDWLTSQTSGAYLFPVQGIVKLFIVPQPLQDLTVQLDYYALLPSYKNDTDEDFLSIYGSDYLIYAALREANYFLRDNEQILIDHQAEQEAFTELVSFDASVKESSEQSPAFND